MSPLNERAAVVVRRLDFLRRKSVELRKQTMVVESDIRRLTHERDKMMDNPKMFTESTYGDAG